VSSSELITTRHLARRAVIYIRQSTPQQVLTNQESLRLQYALRERALELGWQEEQVDVIDSDLGISAASAQAREGFQTLVAQVTLGQVGLILSADVTRLSRNCSDWYPLLDVCGYRRCLIADRDSVYDPSSPNGRLLLGLKGQLSELELHTIRARLTAGLLNKAERGELAVCLPVGLVRDPMGQVIKEPNQEVQERLTLIFETFLRRKAASQVLRYFNEQNLLIPRRNRFGDLRWKKPRIAAILAVLKNPAYAGAFVYGQSRTIRDGSGKSKSKRKRLPREEWRICVQGKYPAYISWQTYEEIQAMLQDNYAAYASRKSRGVPRSGSALLQGIVYCGECGHKIGVQYDDCPSYICNTLLLHYREPQCQSIASAPIDNGVVEAFLQAFSAIELDAYEEIVSAQEQEKSRLIHAHHQQVERLRYEARLAERQYNQVDPENRLVAAELERRWESSLQALRRGEEVYRQAQQETQEVLSLPPEMKEAFMAIGQRLGEIWRADRLSNEQKKALLRTLIEKVVLRRSRQDTVQTRIVWRGGETSCLDIPVPVSTFRALSRAEEMEKLIVEWAHQGHSDQEIAQRLTEQGHRSPRQPEGVLPSTVRNLRIKKRVFRKGSHSQPRRVPGYLTVTQVAEALEIKAQWFYNQIKRKRICIRKDEQSGLYLFPDKPETLEKLALLWTKQVQFVNIDELSQPATTADESMAEQEGEL
jgi:DNA invertase Pin-like site-specific DNA recombinase